jgi:DNA-binding LacI/PurR family transcriptional regulator
LKVIGFDELPWALELHPHLSPLRQPAYRIGREAARLLSNALVAQRRFPVQPYS